MFQERQRQSHTYPPVFHAATNVSIIPPISHLVTGVSQNTTLSTIPHHPIGALAPNTSKPTPTLVGRPLEINPAPNAKTTRNRRPDLPQWSVVHNPKVKQALDLHVAHVFTYETPVYCARISPDGQRIAIGLKDCGKTYINSMKTGSNVWLVFKFFVIDQG